MKKIIRFLARISGVMQDIEDEKRREIAVIMRRHAYWFNYEGNERAYNAMHLYANRLFDFNIPNIDRIREKVNTLDDSLVDANKLDIAKLADDHGL